MLDTSAGPGSDLLPRIVICAWDAQDGGWDPVEDLSGEPWSPAGARTVAAPGGEPEALAGALSAHLADARTRALLLVGRTHHGDAFCVQMRAENRDLAGGGRLDDLGPSLARATAPVADIVRALREAGVNAGATSEAEEDSGSYLLYRVLSALPEQQDTPAVALLRAPVAASDAEITRAVKIVAQEMARHLAPLPRSRAN